MLPMYYTKILPSAPAALMALLLVSATTLPAAAKTAAEAKAFAENAVAHIEAVGAKKAFADFSRPDGGVICGELYMFCYEKDGTNVAGVKQAAIDTAAGQVLGASGDLSRHAEHMTAQVNDFLSAINTA